MDKNIVNLIYGFTRGINSMRYSLGMNSTKSKDNKEYGPEYNFIPSNSKYIFGIEKIIDQEKIQKSDCILDLGCGVSPILSYLAFKGYENLKGIDNERDLISGMRSVLFNIYGENHEDFTEICKNIVVEDLLEFTDRMAEFIKSAKIIYLYQPIQDYKLYTDMVESVISSMNTGSIIVDFYGPIRKIAKKKKLLVKNITLENPFFSSSYYKKK